MNSLLIIAVFLVLAVILAGVFVERRDKNVPLGSFESRHYLLSKAENAFCKELVAALPSGYVVCPKVRVADVIKVSRGVTGRAFGFHFNQISRKHFDFVICDAKTSKIVGVVELDDSSHDEDKRIKRDNYVDAATLSAGLQVVRHKCQSSYNHQQMKAFVDNLLYGRIPELTGEIIQKTNVVSRGRVIWRTKQDETMPNSI